MQLARPYTYIYIKNRLPQRGQIQKIGWEGIPDRKFSILQNLKLSPHESFGASNLSPLTVTYLLRVHMQEQQQN